MFLATTVDWKPAIAHPDLKSGEVHVWRIPLSESNRKELTSLLSRDELIRAERFHFERDRTRFICGRGLLRTILGRYLDTNPCDLKFADGPHGKPELIGSGSALRFNLSHSDDLMLLAVSHARAVGVDLEMIRENVPVETLADHYFDPKEAWNLRLLPPPQRVSRFYELWTSAEARLKADGAGIGQGLQVLEPDRWSLLKLIPAEGYTAALAVEGADFQVECWSWQK